MPVAANDEMSLPAHGAFEDAVVVRIVRDDLQNEVGLNFIGRSLQPRADEVCVLA
ncbi:MAG TPA: hypothetical protein VGF88_19025 [Acidobacteriaceae bacterium]|jgi:hypothetical protein